MSTKCGIPWIQLEGTQDDWKQVRSRAENLCSLMMPQFAAKWSSVLYPVLDQFVNARSSAFFFFDTFDLDRIV